MSGPESLRPELAAHPAAPSSRAALAWRDLLNSRRFRLGATILAVLVVWSLVGGWFSRWHLLDQDLTVTSAPPSTRHWFGTDGVGQDLYVQCVVGLRTSLLIGLVAGPLGTAIAAIVGSVAGYLGGRRGAAIGWFVNLMLVIPSLFLLMVVSPLYAGHTLAAMTVFIAATSWMVMAQVVRGQTRTLRRREFVRAAEYAGVGTVTIIRRHILPHLAGLLAVDATLGVVAAIGSESTLSYFGLGITRPDVSLGVLLADGTAAATTRPWLFCFPAALLLATLLALGLVGDGLRDVLDPHHDDRTAAP